MTSAFYVAADSRHFVGLVALVNSLRLVGHDEPIYVGDCGLVKEHRRRLEDEVIVVSAAEARSPHLAKIVAPLAHPSDVMLLIDADIVVTRPVNELVERARGGALVAFVDRVAHRFDERWSTILGLPPPRRQPYLNSGLVAMERNLGTAVLEQVAEGCELVDVERTIFGNGTSEYPFYYLDQDVLNAVVATYPEHSLQLLEHRLAPFPPFPGLVIVHEAALRCAYDDGVEPYVLHHIGRKPWRQPTRWSIYSQLVSRLLLWDDVAIRLPPSEVPLTFHQGSAAWLERRRNGVLASLRSARNTLAPRSRLRRRLRRRRAAAVGRA